MKGEYWHYSSCYSWRNSLPFALSWKIRTLWKDSENDGNVSRERHRGFLSTPFPCCVIHTATFKLPHKRENLLLIPKLFHGLKDLEEVKSTPYFAWMVMLTGLLVNQNLSQTLFTTSPPSTTERQELTAITEISDKMCLLCKNGKALTAVMAVSIFE